MKGKYRNLLIKHRNVMPRAFALSLALLSVVMTFTVHALVQKANTGQPYQLSYSEGENAKSGPADANYVYDKYTRGGGITGKIEEIAARDAHADWEQVSDDGKTISWRKLKALTDSGRTRSLDSATTKAVLLISLKAVLNWNPDGTFPVSAAVQEDKWQIDSQMKADSKAQCEQDRADVLAKLKVWSVVLTTDQIRRLQTVGTINIPVKKPFANLRKLSKPDVVLKVDCNTPGDRTTDRSGTTSPCTAAKITRVSAPAAKAGVLP